MSYHPFADCQEIATAEHRHEPKAHSAYNDVHPAPATSNSKQPCCRQQSPKRSRWSPSSRRAAIHRPQAPPDPRQRSPARPPHPPQLQQAPAPQQLPVQLPPRPRAPPAPGSQSLSCVLPSHPPWPGGALKSSRLMPWPGVIAKVLRKLCEDAWSLPPVSGRLGVLHKVVLLGACVLCQTCLSLTALPWLVQPSS